MQCNNAVDYVLPFIEEQFVIKPGMRVLEIGCGEGGVLKAFLERDCFGVGVELDESRAINARKFLTEFGDRKKIISEDIYKVSLNEDLGGKFDVIVLKDVIEHIHDQKKLISWLKSFLNTNGIIYFGYPPWQMPFGGHQQVCHSFLKKTPYVHLLPRSIYQWLLKRNNERVDDLMEIVDTRISIEGFERIVRETGFRIQNKRAYLINPIYKWKFGLKVREQFKFISAIPYFRNFVTTCMYYTITPKLSSSQQ